jgi:hypothetical protein
VGRAAATGQACSEGEAEKSTDRVKLAHETHIYVEGEIRMTDMTEYFSYLDGVASETEYSYITSRLGPVFYNVPSPTNLIYGRSLEPAEANKVFYAWARARGWVHPSKDRRWLDWIADPNRVPGLRPPNV